MVGDTDERVAVGEDMMTSAMATGWAAFKKQQRRESSGRGGQKKQNHNRAPSAKRQVLSSRDERRQCADGEAAIFSNIYSVLFRPSDLAR